MVVRFFQSPKGWGRPVILSNLQPNALWRDLLALTWNLTTFHDIIKRFIDEQLFSVEWHGLKVESGEGMTLDLLPFPIPLDES